MQLVDGYKRAWRWLSVQCLAIIAVLPFAWEYIPYEVKSMIPLEWQPYLFSLFALLGVAGRLVKQEPKDGQ